MDGFTLDGVWLVSLVAAAGSVWIARSAGGVVRNLVAEKGRRVPRSRDDDWLGGKCPARVAPMRARAARSNRKERKALDTVTLTWSGEALTFSNRPRSAVQPFAGMMPLSSDVESMRAEADAIRRDAKIWNSPDSESHAKRIARRIEVDPIDILVEFRAAIEELERLNRLSEGRLNLDEEPVAYSIEPPPLQRTLVY